MKLKHTLSLLALFAGAPLARAGSHTWNGAVSSSWNNAANWSAGGKPVAGEANVALIFPVGATRYSVTNDIPGLAVHSLTLNGSYTLSGSGGAALTFTGGGASVTVNGSQVNTIASSLPVVLNAGVLISLNHAAARLTLDSTVSGSAGFAQDGPGIITLSGLNANTYTGITQVLQGELRLSQAGLVPALAVPGRLVIGTANLAEPAVVRLYQNHQIGSVEPVILNPSGTLALNGKLDTLGELRLYGGTITTDNGADAGELRLGGEVLAENANSYIYGHVSLGGVSRTLRTTTATLFLHAVTADGGGNAGLLKTGGGGLLLSGANTYAGATLVQQGTLILATGGQPGSTAAGTVVEAGASLFLITTGVGDEPLSLSGTGNGGNTGALRAEGATSWGGPVTFAADSTVNVTVANETLTFSDRLDGAGAFIKTGPGRVLLTGMQSNLHTGGTVVDAGELLLSVGNGGTAIPGPLTVGNPLGAPDSARVWPTASHQIADTAAVTVHASGRLSIQDQNDTIGTLSMFGGEVDGTSGTWTLGGDIFADNGSSLISGKLSLGGATRTVHTQDGQLIVDAVISNGAAIAGLVKTGPGTLELRAVNTYQGLTEVSAGALRLSYSGRPGNSDQGTTVATGASVLLFGHTVSGESLTFLAGPAPGGLLDTEGACAWSGNIAVFGEAHFFTRAAGGVLSLSGSIIGNPDARLVTRGAGSVRFTGGTDNLYPCPTWVKSGTLLLDKLPGITAVPGTLLIGDAVGAAAAVRPLSSGQIADTAAVTVSVTGLLNLSSQPETIGSLAGDGHVQVDLSTLTTGGNGADTTFSGILSGIGTTALIKQGGGRMSLTGSNTCSGKCVVNAGNLFIHGVQTSSAATVNAGGFLNGHGQTGAITSTDGIVAPGSDGVFGPGLARLKCNGATFSSGTGFWLEFAGTDAGTNYSQLEVNGLVSLGNALPKLRMAFASPIGTQFMIIKNDGADAIIGTFRALPQGATLTSTDGTQFTISYTGGTGNDAVITQTSLPPVPVIDDSSITTADGPGGPGTGPTTVNLTGHGVPGLTYAFEASSDLAAWTVLESATAAPVTGGFAFTFTEAPGVLRRFYRVRLL
ncbi:MAG: beta strand repeat-containing protein [Verrucomicrobiales bacterium]